MQWADHQSALNDVRWEQQAKNPNLNLILFTIWTLSAQLRLHHTHPTVECWAQLLLDLSARTTSCSDVAQHSHAVMITAIRQIVQNVVN